jgi:hypothetical protein
MTKVEKIETIRVRFEDGFYCDITPTANTEGCHDFIIRHEDYNVSTTMFACTIQSEECAIEIAEANAPEYIPDLKKLCK